MTNFTDQPCAAKGLNSYRYLGRYGWIMIGAKNDDDALKEAARSTDSVSARRLEYWNGIKYVPVASR